MKNLPPKNVAAGVYKDPLQTWRSAKLSKLMTERQKVGKHEEGDTVDDVDSNKYNDNFDKGDPVV